MSKTESGGSGLGPEEISFENQTESTEDPKIIAEKLISFEESVKRFYDTEDQGLRNQAEQEVEENIESMLTTALRGRIAFGETERLDYWSWPDYWNNLLYQLRSRTPEDKASPFEEQVDNFLEKNLNLVEQADVGAFLSECNRLMDTNDPDKRKIGTTRALSVMEKAPDELNKDYYAPVNACQILSRLAQQESEEVFERTRQILKHFSPPPHITDFRYYLSEMLAGSYHSYRYRDDRPKMVENSSERAKILIQDKYGVDPKYLEKFLDLWRKVWWSTPIDAIGDQLNTFLDIETARPGVAEVLNREFGIVKFGSYPSEVLIHQYDQINDINHPYGVVIVGEANEKGKLDAQHLGHLYKQLEGKYNLRIVECDSVTTLARHLISLDKKYGSHQKISFAILISHGGDWVTELGSFGVASNLYAKHLQGRGAQRIRDFFVENPQIIMESCSAGGGGKGSMAQHLSRALHAHVTAPNVDINTAEINATFDDQSRLNLETKFRPSIRVTPTGKIEVIYNNGELEEPEEGKSQE